MYFSEQLSLFHWIHLLSELYTATWQQKQGTLQTWTVWFGLVWFYGISTIVGYLMLNLFYTYILIIYDLVWFGLVLWHINHSRLFSAKSSLYIHIKYIWFGFVWFYGISTIVGYLMPNLLYTYLLNIYDLVSLGFMAYQPL